MRLVCISDTHTKHEKVSIPEGDILIHAGDFSKRGRTDEVVAFNNWLSSLPHSHKIVIAGNHDFLFEDAPEQAQKLLTAATYLEDSGSEIEGIHFWGSPVSPRFFNWAFNRDRGSEIARHWDLIPENTDILIVHGPPKGILDRVWLGSHVGCEELPKAISRVQPRLVIFGHIHESYGIEQKEGILYVNAALLNRLYQPSHSPIVLEWEAERITVLN